MSEAVCENCGTAYPYHVKRGCDGRRILPPPSEPLKEAVKPEPNIAEIAQRHADVWANDTHPFQSIRDAFTACLSEYAESLKER